MFVSVYDGVYFIEGACEKATVISNISTVLDGCFDNSQLKSLDDVKHAMAEQVKTNGGNAVIEFKYGQRDGGFWRSLLSWDNVFWRGEGKIAIVDPVYLKK